MHAGSALARRTRSSLVLAGILGEFLLLTQFLPERMVADTLSARCRALLARVGRGSIRWFGIVVVHLELGHTVVAVAAHLHFFRLCIEIVRSAMFALSREL